MNWNNAVTQTFARWGIISLSFAIAKSLFLLYERGLGFPISIPGGLEFNVQKFAWYGILFCIGGIFHYWFVDNLK